MAVGDSCLGKLIDASYGKRFILDVFEVFIAK